MFLFKRKRIRSYEMGLLFRDGEFRRLLGEGTHWFYDPLNKVRVDIVSQREPALVHDKLDLIVKSGALAKRTVVLDLKDHERALVWIDDRFAQILGPGRYAYWTGQKKVRHEVIDARSVRFEHEQRKVILGSPLAQRMLDICTVQRDAVGVLYVDGRYVETLPPGEYAFWKGAAPAVVVEVDLRETMVDVSGQEIMTADKVTLRLNAVVTYKIVDARKAVSQTDDVRQALYRETQLVLRAAVGARRARCFVDGQGRRRRGHRGERGPACR